MLEQNIKELHKQQQIVELKDVLDKLIVVTAIVVLGIIQTVALLQDVNGAKFALIVAAISGLAGFKIHSLSIEKIRKKIVDDSENNKSG